MPEKGPLQRRTKNESRPKSIPIARATRRRGSRGLPGSQRSALATGNCLWLALSGLTKTSPWICYYKAIKDGDVSTVAILMAAGLLVIGRK